MAAKTSLYLYFGGLSWQWQCDSDRTPRLGFGFGISFHSRCFPWSRMSDRSLENPVLPPVNVYNYPSNTLTINPNM